MVILFGFPALFATYLSILLKLSFLIFLSWAPVPLLVFFPGVYSSMTALNIDIYLNIDIMNLPSAYYFL